MNNKTINEFGFRIMKNYGDLGGCYPPNTLLDLHNSSKDTQPHSLIVNYYTLYSLSVSSLAKSLQLILEISGTCIY